MAVSPSHSSISFAARNVAIGLTLYMPAYLGAEPWVGSKTPYAIADIAGRGESQAADELGGQVGDDVAEQVFGDEDVVIVGDS